MSYGRIFLWVLNMLQPLPQDVSGSLQPLFVLQSLTNQTKYIKGRSTTCYEALHEQLVLLGS